MKIEKILISMLFLSVVKSSLAASFDCNSISMRKIENMICSSRKVSNLDDEMAKEYVLLKSMSDDKETVKQGQLKWIKKRDKCDSESCLIKIYDQRNQELKREISLISDKPGVSWSLKEGGAAKVCNLLYQHVISRKIESASEIVASLGEVKDVVFPERREITPTQYYGLYLMNAPKDVSDDFLIQNDKKVFPRIKYFLQKVDFYNDGGEEYVTFSETGAVGYKYSPGFKVLTRSEDRYFPLNENYYGWVFSFDGVVHILRFEEDYFSVRTPRKIKNDDVVSVVRLCLVEKN